MKIVFIGDIFGKIGREKIKSSIPILIEKYQPDWIVANGENVTGGNGISAKHARLLKEAGIDVLTSGNHVFARNDWVDVVKSEPYLLRPHNLTLADAPGRGINTFFKDGVPALTVINLSGRVFMDYALCPFKAFDQLYETAPKDVPIFVDFHAEATSEKSAFFWYVDGRASVVVGTHTHVQTSDERIMPQGTAVITDVGMVGSRDSVIGVSRETIIMRFVKGYSNKFLSGPLPAKLEGVFVKIEGVRASCIESFRLV